MAMIKIHAFVWRSTNDEKFWGSENNSKIDWDWMSSPIASETVLLLERNEESSGIWVSGTLS